MKCLFVLPNHKDGFWLSEMSHPRQEIVWMGGEVVFASPIGGVAPISPHSDPNSLPGLGKEDATSRAFLDEAGAVEALEHTLPLAGVSIEDYDVVHLVGGLGSAIDFYPNPELGRLVAAAWIGGKVVSAIGHGVLGLINAIVDEAPLIRGKRLTACSLAEDRELEAMSGMKMPVVPHYPQVVLEAAGAFYEARPPRTPLVVRDGNLLTGQNPQSSTLLGVALADLLRLG